MAFVHCSLKIRANYTSPLYLIRYVLVLVDIRIANMSLVGIVVVREREHPVRLPRPVFATSLGISPGQV